MGTLQMSERFKCTRRDENRKFISMREKQTSRKETPLRSADFALMLSMVSKRQKMFMKITAIR